MGDANRIHAHVVIGDDPQDLSFQGAETWVEIGDNNIIREGCDHPPLHRPGAADAYGLELFLDGLLTRRPQLPGRQRRGNDQQRAARRSREIGDQVVLGGGAAVHQFCRVGAMAMVSGLGRRAQRRAAVHGRPRGSRAPLPAQYGWAAPRRGYGENVTACWRTPLESCAARDIAHDHPSTLEVDHLRPGWRGRRNAGSAGSCAKG